MCQEVFEIVRGMDRKSIETQLAMQCAPLITGIKISNLLIIPAENEKTLRAVLMHTGICFYRLLKTDDRITFLLFRRNELEAYMNRTEIQGFFKREGYTDFTLGCILRTFQLRYQAYMIREMAFPHEMGLLLGYPVEDVRGFIEHQGRDYLCTGYWKVYENLEQKQQLFQRFEYAKENLVLLLSYGVGMADIMDIFGGTGQKTLYQECAG